MPVVVQKHRFRQRDRCIDDCKLRCHKSTAKDQIDVPTQGKEKPFIDSSQLWTWRPTVSPRCLYIRSNHSMASGLSCATADSSPDLRNARSTASTIAMTSAAV